ncbi:MAG: (2Fe-2S) ferredoxin domain-containing protein [Chloroflexaceae bacterium]|jgi:(2Fe-2S) ferredoxin|nr:(2Fe-2S) ferredoxin domain-containing protein [Chloroflexaceae bacterium]
MSETKLRLYLCTGPHCSARNSAALRDQLEMALWARGLDATVEFHTSGCQDHCDYGPNLLIWPGPIRYYGLTPAILEQIIARHLKGGEPVTEQFATPEMRRKPR